MAAHQTAKPAVKRKQAKASAQRKSDAPDPLSLPELQRRLANPDIPIETLEPYLLVVPDPETGAPKLAPNPKTVSQMDDPGLRTRGMGGMDALNGAERVRRRVAFERRLIFEKKPVILAEGDSWFEYPFFLADTIDALSRDYNVFCLSAAGDTMANMSANIEVVESLFTLVETRKLPVRAVILSAGGNDIVGDTLARCVRTFAGQTTAEELLDRTRLQAELDKAMHGYQRIIAKLRAVRGDVPILVHGYDHAIPLNPPLPDHPWAKDPIRKIAPRDGWLATPLRSKKIMDPKLQAGIVRLMIDAFYARLEGFADATGTGTTKGVYLIDNRRTVKARWNDELHPTDAGFADVAANFAKVLKALP